jgi:hypothetical protein
MILLIRRPSPDRARHLLYLSKPALWPAWPFLPVVRRKPGVEEEDCGLLYDPPTATETPKSGVTVYLGNLFLLPSKEAEFLALPREEFISPEAAYDAGWRVD